jgi:hypothetical protein
MSHPIGSIPYLSLTTTTIISMNSHLAGQLLIARAGSSQLELGHGTYSTTPSRFRARHTVIRGVDGSRGSR